MKTNTIILVISLLGIQSSVLHSHSFKSGNHKQAAFCTALGALGVFAFKQYSNTQTQYYSLLQANIPNWDIIMAQTFKHCTTQRQWEKLWNNFITTQVKAVCPELMPQLSQLDYKSGLFFGTGFVLTVIALCGFLDYFFPMNKVSYTKKRQN